MRIEQLEYFAAVTRHGSLRRASEQLHLSQPALSESLTKLERELGVRLLERGRTGTRVSTSGEDLLPHVHAVIDSIQRLRDAADESADGLRAIRLGTVNVATAALVLPAAHELRRAHPTTPLELVTASTSQVHRGLLDGSLDLGLVTARHDDPIPSGLQAVDLIVGRAVAVLPRGHALTRRRVVSVAELRRERFVMMRPGYLMHDVMRELFEGRLPRDSHSTDGAEMGKTLVAEGLGVTVLPDFSLAGDPRLLSGDLCTRPLRVHVGGIALTLRSRPGAPASHAVRTLEQSLIARAAALDSERAAERDAERAADEGARDDPVSARGLVGQAPEEPEDTAGHTQHDDQPQ